MNYKLIATDLDDTLLNLEGKLSQSDRKAIIKAQEKGVKYVLASGRPTFAMKDFAHELELVKYNSFLISYNGAVIYDVANEKTIFEDSLTAQDAHLLYHFAKENGCEIITYLGDTIISEGHNEFIQVELDLTKMPLIQVENFKNAVQKNVIKCIILADPEHLVTVEKKLKEKHSENYSIARSKPFFLEITRKGIDKGETLKRLCSLLDISLEECIAVGDSYNDITMLEAAGLGIAVENAKDAVKDVADFITHSNTKNGTEYLIEKFIFNSTF